MDKRVMKRRNLSSPRDYWSSLSGGRSNLRDRSSLRDQSSQRDRSSSARSVESGYH